LAAEHERWTARNSAAHVAGRRIRYHYRVESEDEAGNVAASSDLTFKTKR
jgi:hypothetical protein